MEDVPRLRKKNRITRIDSTEPSFLLRLPSHIQPEDITGVAEGKLHTRDGKQYSIKFHASDSPAYLVSTSEPHTLLGSVTTLGLVLRSPADIEQELKRAKMNADDQRNQSIPTLTSMQQEQAIRHVPIQVLGMEHPLRAKIRSAFVKHGISKPLSIRALVKACGATAKDLGKHLADLCDREEDSYTLKH
jgi:hypothetical protein